ncbi:Hint domain-containing protein [Aliiroseovarius sp.]|uniref:Hint domain-containing protein n=1 Tax=Aliiroseovarius sp. TaxID=1872442 RepID=UPI00260D494E|nr:Hint domain-containing protein [Aliiroseovarius sp.]
MVQASELNIDTGASATEMAEEIFGEGVQVVGATYTGDNRSSGIYTGGETTSPGVTPSDTGVMFSTGRLSGFTNSSGNANQDNNQTTSSRGENGNDWFDDLAGIRTYDASYLDVDIIPDGDVLTLQFTFASEEYPEYAGSIYNDIVGIWVDGEYVELSIGGDTSVGNVSDASNENLYVSNTGSEYNTEMDGFTATMTVNIPVTSGEVNSIRIGIADVADSQYDSTLIIAGDSGQTALIAGNDVVNVHPDQSATLDVTANDIGPIGGTVVVTHINGIAVSSGDSVTLTTGQVITLNADGTLTVTGDGDEETVNFSYTVETSGSTGPITDTAFVTINSIPCFVAGTLIATPHGDKRVETLSPGDMVLTHDNGPQPLRWIGRRVVPALESFAPIRIVADTFGQHGELLLSPQHRVLIRDALAELLFGETEVLVAAKDLVNDRSVRRNEGGEVEYVHLLFDRHEVIYSEGLATESYLPGPQTTRSFEADLVREICTLFPEIDPDTGLGYSSAARRTLRTHEARVLMASGQAA